MPCFSNYWNLQAIFLQFCCNDIIVIFVRYLSIFIVTELEYLYVSRNINVEFYWD